mmetsp:Transcript_4323/g.10426  ORF Transcript_4323/g.10426 Transcript_4323/m.10426 type:complete len:90 (+) Transcript_4323:664-933(+)
MASGQDSATCRDALKDVTHQLKQLTRASRISPIVSQRVIDYVNQSDKIILAQSWVLPPCSACRPPTRVFRSVSRRSRMLAFCTHAVCRV